MKERAVILGGTSGVGLATVRLLHENGYDVFGTGRDKAKIDRLQQEFGGEVPFSAINSEQYEDLESYFRRLGKIDHLVLTLSGGKGMGLLKDLNLQELHEGFESKFWAHVQSAKAALPFLSASASITFISGISARMAIPGTSGLAAINGAIESLVRPLSAEFAPIRVNAVSPGVINTPWWNWLPEKERTAAFKQYAQASLVGRVGQPEDIADVIAFLIKNTFMTGQVITCDGGLSLKSGG